MGSEETRQPRRLPLLLAAVGLAIAAALVGYQAYQAYVVEPRVAEEAFRITRLTKPVVAPDFRIELPNGATFSLAQARGKVVFLNFWATWCPPCRDEMPSMVQLARELSSRYPGRFVMVAVSVDEGWKPIFEFFQGPPPPGIVVGLDREQLATRAYYCAARGGCPTDYKFPETYVVDREGRLVEYVVGPRDWSEPGVRHMVARLAD
jgi:thiol-disulfide isomerase/thioredoxin